MHGDSAHMPDEKSIRRHHAELIGFRVACLVFFRFARGVFRRPTATVADSQVAERDVLNAVTRNSREQTTEARIDVARDDVADVHPANCAGRWLSRAARTVSEPNE